MSARDQTHAEERWPAVHSVAVRDRRWHRAFLGVFILVADEDQYVGIGGDLSWRVGDISSAWATGCSEEDWSC